MRFEHFNGSIDERGVGARTLRAGAAFRRDGPTCRTGTTSRRASASPGTSQGNGKTAVKFGIGKYVRAYSTGFADTYDPNFYSSATLTWNDLNKDDTAQGARGCVYLTAGCEIDFSTLPANFGTKPTQNPADGI